MALVKDLKRAGAVRAVDQNTPPGTVHGVTLGVPLRFTPRPGVFTRPVCFDNRRSLPPCVGNSSDLVAGNGAVLWGLVLRPSGAVQHVTIWVGEVVSDILLCAGRRGTMINRV